MGREFDHREDFGDGKRADGVLRFGMIESGEFKRHIHSGIDIELKLYELLGIDLLNRPSAGTDQFPRLLVSIRAMRWVVEVRTLLDSCPTLPPCTQQVRRAQTGRHRPPHPRHPSGTP